MHTASTLLVGDLEAFTTLKTVPQLTTVLQDIHFHDRQSHLLVR